MMIQAHQSIILDTGNIIKCKQLTKKVFETLSDEMVESTRHCLDSLSRSSSNVGPAVEYTHENHSSVVDGKERDQVRVCVKVFLTPFVENELGEAVRKALTQLDVNRIESLIVAFPQTLNQKINLEQMQPIWKICEELVAQGYVSSVGVADLDLSQLSELYYWAPCVKPTTNQLHVDAICKLSQQMIDFATETNIQLLSHGDDLELTNARTASKILEGYRDDAEKWLCDSVTRYTVSFRCRGVLHSKGYIVKLRRQPS